MSVVANVAINVDSTKAVQDLNKVKAASKDVDGGLQSAGQGAKGFGASLAAALGPLLAVGTAVDILKKGLTTAFERGGAEQRLKNLTGSTEEYQAALAIAARSADKFGMSQTETTKALADVFGRLKGVGFGLKETGEIYDGFNIIAKQSGLSAADASGAFFQLSQSLGKGKLNGDEFVSISERMPGVLDAIAQSTGRSRGELAKMGADGELSSRVIYDALSSVGVAAGDLNAKLTEQQRAFNTLGQVSDRLLNIIGQVFGPVVIKGAELLGIVGQELAEYWEYLGGVIFPKVVSAVQPLVNELTKVWNAIPWDTLLGLLQGVLIKAIDGIVFAIGLISPIIAFVVKKFFELSQNPVFKFIADQVLRLAGLLGISTNEVQEFNEKGKKSNEEAAGLVNKFSSLPPVVAAATKEVSAMEKSLQSSAIALEAQQTALKSQVETNAMVGSIVGARLEAEKQLNGLQKIQLEQQYELATTAERRRVIAVQIFNNAAQAAKIEYQQALASIALENAKAKIAVQQAILKGQQIFAEGQLQILQSKSVEEENKKRVALQGALTAQNQVIIATGQQAQAQQIIGKYQAESAASQFKSKIATAGIALQQKLVSDKIGLSQQSALGLSNQLQSGYTNTNSMAMAGQELQAKMNQASLGIQAGTKAAQQGVISYSAGANVAGESTEQWRKRVLEGIGAQNKIAETATSTGKVIAKSYGNSAAAAAAADKTKVKTATDANALIVKNNGFSVERLQKNWGTFVAFFNASVIMPISKAWQSIVEFLPKALTTAANTIKSVFTGVGTAIKAVLNSILRGVFGAVNGAIDNINRLIAAANNLSAKVKGPQLATLPRLNIPQFAEGGIVTRPTLAMVGEGGEPEYIIPESKMAATASNYLAGQRGAGAIESGGGGGSTINITTGPVVEFNGERYVTMADFERGLQQAAGNVYQGLRRPTTRRALGLA